MQDEATLSFLFDNIHARTEHFHPEKLEKYRNLMGVHEGRAEKVIVLYLDGTRYKKPKLIHFGTQKQYYNSHKNSTCLTKIEGEMLYKREGLMDFLF